MTIATKIILGTARSPFASIVTTLLCLPLFNLSKTTTAGLAVGMAFGIMTVGFLMCFIAPTPRLTRRLHQLANYRLPALCVGVACAWVGRELVPLGECPSTALMILGGYIPAALGGISGAQFVAAIYADGLRLARTWRRASLCAAIARRERERRAAR